MTSDVPCPGGQGGGYGDLRDWDRCQHFRRRGTPSGNWPTQRRDRKPLDGVTFISDEGRQGASRGPSRPHGRFAPERAGRASHDRGE